MKTLITLAVFFFASPGLAQSSLSGPLTAEPLASAAEGAPTKFNWPAIERCAADPKHQWRFYCQSWLDARAEGERK